MKNIDLQVNGYLGISFSSETLTEDIAREALSGLVENGAELFLPTIITSSEETFQKNLQILSGLIETDFADNCPGIHLEGPFLCPQEGAVGAHNPEWVQKPDCDAFKRYQDYANGKIKILTVAAGEENVESLIAYAVSTGVRISLGHQLANGEDLKRAAGSGATALTHFCNGLPNMIHRHNNTIWAALANDDLTAMIIADGHHIPVDLIKVIFAAKGIDKTIVVSDASSYAGMPPGDYHGMGNRIVIEENGLLHNPDKGCLVGSSFIMPDCIDYLESIDLFSQKDIKQMVYDNPNDYIGL